MSSNRKSEPPADAPIATKPQSHSQPKPHPIDVKLDRLTKDVLPPAPYLLRLRNRSSQYHSRDRYYWRKGTLFSEDEEELQYLTFLPTHDGTLLYAHGQWDDGNGGIAPKDLSSSRASRGQTPGTGQVAKKKISLAEYAKMDKSKKPTANAPVMKESVGKISQQASEAPNKEVIQTKDEIQHTAPSQPIDTKERRPSPARKRSADTMAGAEQAPVTHEASAPHAKKSRLETKPMIGDVAQEKASQKDKSPSPTSHSVAVAAPSDRQRDVLEKDNKSKSKASGDAAVVAKPHSIQAAPFHGLPPMLSPTLPADIEEELAKRTPGPREGLASSRASSVSPSRHGKDQKRKVSDGGKDKASSVYPTPSTPRHHKRDITSAPRPHSEDDLSQLKREPKKSKIVTLKIRNKANRRILVQYLRMKPTPNRGTHNITPKSTPADGTTRSNAQSKPSKQSNPFKQDESSDTDEPLANIRNKKRLASERDDDDAGKSNTKREKRSGQHHDQALKPLQSSRPTSSSKHDQSHAKSAISTPTPSVPSSAQKSHLSVVSTSMQRTGSQESVATPARDGTPNANGHKVESPERLQWKKEVRAEMNRLVKLATEIKHDSDVYLRHLKGQEYEKYRKLGSVIATEATLCFMLAAIVSDEPGRSSNTHTNPELWKSTRNFISSLSSTHAKTVQYLYGFLRQLEGLICDTISYQYDMRGQAILREYNRLKSQEAVAVSSNADSYIAENWSYLKDAQEVRVLARNAWREGQHGLFDPDLERQFPKTWSRRRDFPGRGKGRDPVSLQKYGKEGFALPLGINSTALDAANFGLSFLAELCEKDGIKWEPKLVL